MSKRERRRKMKCTTGSGIHSKVCFLFFEDIYGLLIFYLMKIANTVRWIQRVENQRGVCYTPFGDGSRNTFHSSGLLVSNKMRVVGLNPMFRCGLPFPQYEMLPSYHLLKPPQNPVSITSGTSRETTSHPVTITHWKHLIARLAHHLSEINHLSITFRSMNGIVSGGIPGLRRARTRVKNHSCLPSASMSNMSYPNSRHSEPNQYAQHDPSDTLGMDNNQFASSAAPHYGSQYAEGHHRASSVVDAAGHANSYSNQTHYHQNQQLSDNRHYSRSEGPGPEYGYMPAPQPTGPIGVGAMRDYFQNRITTPHPGGSGQAAWINVCHRPI